MQKNYREELQRRVYVPEDLMPRIFISVRAIRHALCFLSGALGYIALKLLLQL